MEKALPPTSPSLELTISFPGSSSGGGGGSREMSGIKNLDINQLPEDADQEWMNLITSNSTNYSSNMVMENIQVEGSASAPPRKKLRLSNHQSEFLEDTFRLNKSLDTKQKEVLAMKLDLTPRQVEVWFQNRRARSKLKQTETECEYLRRWFTSLTELNCSLQKEVDELRALKAAATTYATPPASICTRCHLITTDQPQS